MNAENRLDSPGRDWSIVLAGGNGNRLSSLTRDPSLGHVPKQYCSLEGDLSLLEAAILRARSVTRGGEVVVVVADEHAAWWRPIERRWPSVRFLSQVADRGTAAGLLLPLQQIRLADPEAVVAVFAADHFVDDEAVLASAIRESMETARRERRVVLLGLEPEEDDGELGWIVPLRSDGKPSPVVEFREKPGRDAEGIRRRGGLINGCLLAGHVASWLALYERTVPELVEAFEEPLPYDAIPPRDLSRHVLEPSATDLIVRPVAHCGWSDLGLPLRVEKVVRRRQPPALPSGSRGLPVLSRAFLGTAAFAVFPDSDDVSLRNCVELL